MRALSREQSTNSEDAVLAYAQVRVEKGGALGEVFAVEIEY